MAQRPLLSITGAGDGRLHQHSATITEPALPWHSPPTAQAQTPSMPRRFPATTPAHLSPRCAAHSSPPHPWLAPFQTAPPPLPTDPHPPAQAKAPSTPPPSPRPRTHRPPGVASTRSGTSACSCPGRPARPAAAAAGTRRSGRGHPPPPPAPPASPGSASPGPCRTSARP